MTDANRFNQGAPGMMPDGKVNTVGPDGKPTHPLQIYTKSGEVLTVDEYDAEQAPDDLSDLEEVEGVFGVGPDKAGE